MSTSQKREWLIMVGLVLIVTSLRLPFIGQPFENDSGALAYHARLIERGEPLYGTHHPAHHMPGIYYTYAMAFELFGDQVQSVKTLLTAWTVVTIYLIYQLGTLVAGRFVGLTAAGMAAVLYAQPLLAGTTSRIENFVGLPQTAVILLLFYLIKKRSKPWQYLWVGFFIGVTFLFKVNSIFSPLVITGLAIAVESRRHKSWRLFLQRAAWISAGFAIVLIPAILFFSIQGLLSRWLLAFDIGLTYAQLDGRDGLSHPFYLLLYPLLLLARANPVVLVSALAGIVILIRTMVRAKKWPPAGDLTFIGYIALWFLLCFIETGVSRIYLNNYYLVCVPSLTLLAAWFWSKLYQDTRELSRTRSGWIVPVLLGGAIIAALFFGIRDNLSYYTHYYLRYLTGQESYDEVLVAGMPEGVGESMLAMREIAEYMKNHTDPGDTIYSWSNLMELYYMADRRSAKDIIWPVYVGATGPPEEVLSATYILLGQDVPLGFSVQPDWLRTGLETHYELETTLYGQDIYRRIPESN